MSVYDRFGVIQRINAAGTLTRLGGTLMEPAVLDAMREAAGSFVDMAELQAAASRVIAEATGAEAGIVTSGAAAALTLGTAACIAGLDAARMDRLPDTDGMADQVIMCRMHRTGYDHAIRAAGARIVEVGFNDRGTGAGVRGVEPWEIEAAITPETVAIAYAATPQGQPPLPEVAAVAEARGLPVIVDAAAQLPPRKNLRRYIAEGASLVAYSGGKAIRGPQSSGILAGRRDLIASAALQMLDMDVSPATWAPPADLIPRDALRGIPHHGLGRGFKVGKEEIAGLMVALERFGQRDLAAETTVHEARLQTIASALEAVPHCRCRIVPPGDAGRWPELAVSLDEAALGRDVAAVSRALMAGSPPIHAGEGRTTEGVLTIKPDGLRDGDEAIIAERLVAALTRGS